MQSRNASFLSKLNTDFFCLRRDGDDEEKAMASRLFERVREAIRALAIASRSTSPAGRGPV
ncbi:MAG TPA: hypothetical protein VIA62_04555 [Thermoanaerobaculia bacterium]|jgi:hypothetical protein|nr:hypothetical protein [Thermoanaerobaculia bacterium]